MASTELKKLMCVRSSFAFSSTTIFTAAALLPAFYRYQVYLSYTLCCSNVPIRVCRELFSPICTFQAPSTS